MFPGKLVICTQIEKLKDYLLSQTKLIKYKDEIIETLHIFGFIAIFSDIYPLA